MIESATMADWERIYRDFDPEQPVTEHSEWRVRRPRSPADRVIRLLDLPTGPTRILLTGTVGSGKSTELFRIAEARAGKEFVLFLDLDRHFTRVVGDPAALRKVAPWEVCFLVGVALARAVEERLGEPFPKAFLKDLEDAWRSAARASDTPDPGEFDVAALGKAMLMFASAAPAAIAGSPTAAGVALATSGLLALKEAIGGAKWRLGLGKSKKDLVDQDDELRGMLLVVNRMIAEIQRQHQPVLLVIDGLDRITDLGHARALFVDSQMLSQFECASVVCGPFALRHRPEVANVRGFRAVTLVNEPVMDKGDLRQTGDGVEVLQKIFYSRVGDDTTLVEAALLQRLAWCSGGRARDFIRFVRMLAEQVLLDGAQAASAAHVEAVLDEARRLRETGLNTHHIKVLRALAMDSARRMPADAEAWNLLNWDCILPYPNDSEWFCPHPLLLLRLVSTWPTGSDASSTS
jgi:hypothetical protein